MIGILTWTGYGTWLAGAARGWVDAGQEWAGGELPEPDEGLSRLRGGSLKWPAVRLGAGQRAVVLIDLARIAALRGFILIAAAVAANHAHLLLETDEDCDIPRLVQLTKGALSRALTVYAGDRPAISMEGEAIAHHKWWTRQYSFLRVVDERAVDEARRRILEHEADGATVRAVWPERGALPDD